MATLRRSPLFSFLSALAFGSILLTTLLPGLAFGAPLVAITRPVQGAIVSGQIWIDVAFNASNNLPVTRLEVYIDDQLAREVDLAQPMLMGRQSFNWDFTYSSNSTHKIGARAIDSGNNAAVASISVQVQNAATTGPDVIAPVVRIYYPAQGAKVHGATEIKAEATDNVGVELVYFYVDGRLHKMMMNAPPYADAWDTTRETDGLHVLEAVAVDKAENEARSAQVTVIVENRSATSMATGGAVNTLGLTPSALPTDVTPAPAPVVPAPAPAPAPLVAGLGDASLPPAPAATQLTPAPAPAPAPKVVNVVPWAQTPTYVPPPPTITLPPVGSSTPVAVGNDRHSGLAMMLTAKTTTSSQAAALPAPGVDASRPDAVGAMGSAPKTAAPAIGGLATVVPVAQAQGTARSEQPVGPVAIQSKQPASGLMPLHAATTAGLEPVAPLPTATQPRLAMSLPTSPSLAKSSAPAGELKTAIGGRMSLPGRGLRLDSPAPVKTSRQAGLAPLVVTPRTQDVSRVEPVGAAVVSSATKPAALRPATVVRPSKPSVARAAAPHKVAAGVRPSVAPLITDAALAEYRGLPVPASRMTSRLPESRAASVAADGRITKPEGNVAAVPIAVAKLRDIKIVFDGEVLSLRATPETRRGISLAPLREIFEQTDGVLYWFPVEKQVRAVNKGVDMSLKIGDPKLTVNGEQRVLQIAPYVKSGRTMVPLQFIADLLDVNIAVNSATGDIMISSNQQ